MKRFFSIVIATCIVVTMSNNIQAQEKEDSLESVHLGNVVVTANTQQRCNDLPQQLSK